MTLSLVRMRFSAAAAKIETTPGTDAIAGTPASTDWIAGDFQVDFNPQVIDNPELTGTLDGKPLLLTAGLNAATPLGRSTALTLRTTFKNRTYQAYAGNVELGKNERALLLLLPPFYRGSLEVQSRLLIDAPGGVRGLGGRP